LAGRQEVHWGNLLKYYFGSKEYEDDKKHGKGIFEWSDGRKYIGIWINGIDKISK
jgi:hypothetical protein